jgi:hypothetical protein
MTPSRSFIRTTVVAVITVPAMLLLIACQSSQQQSTPAPAAVSSQAPSTEKVFVLFEGPWAFAPDPKDAGSVVAIAPRTKGHHDLFVKASNQSTLASGTYDLSLPAHTGSAAATADSSIAQIDIDPKSLQGALDKKSERYVVRLPKPEEYLVAARSRSRLGTTYPPDASTEKDYASAVSLRYNVSTLSGFSLSGTPDSGSFNPFLLRVEVPVIRFVIRPSLDDDPKDKCDGHSRESFHELTTLLGLTLYVDFPDYPPDCHSKDPQNAHPAKAQVSSSFNRLVALLTGNLTELPSQSASVSTDGMLFGGLSKATDGLRGIASHFAVVMYFFNMPQADCASPHIILRPTT